jgi:hypothetical protein
MGRHAAADGGAADPIVEAALRGRPEGNGPRHGSLDPTASTEGGLGWPGEPEDGTGQGWPVDQLPDDGVQAPAAVLAVAETPAPRRGGWRRLFSSRAA